MKNYTKIDESLEFEKHASIAFFASAWADAADEYEDSPIGPGTEILEVMPKKIDPAAIRVAHKLRMDIESVNGKTIGDMLGIIERDGDGDRPNTVEWFGHYAAMQAMGHGVGLWDAFGSDVSDAIKIPYVEFNSLSLEKAYF